MANELIIPDIRNTNLPVGWAEFSVIPVVMEAAWEDLDEYEAGLRAMASYIESLEKGEAVEFEKALRIVEARRGELLGIGDGTPGRRVSHATTHGSMEQVALPTATRYRKIARHWSVVWPEIVKSNERREVTQAAVLRMIERIEEAAKPPKPEAKPEPTPSPKEAEPEADEGWGEMDLLAEFERVVEDAAKKDEIIEHLSKPDQHRENLALLSRIAGLEARIGQLTTTAREAQNQATAQGKVLRKVRDLLRVERNSEIVPAIEGLMR
jgi:hypothetical protein